MDSSTSKSKSKNRKRKNRNRKNKNPSQSNGNKDNICSNKIPMDLLKNSNQQLPSSPRPKNISKNNFVFETKRSSGSEFEEFHTPSCEYPEFKNCNSTKENDLDQQWNDLQDFKSSSLEGIPEINYSQNLITNDFAVLNTDQSFCTNNWQKPKKPKPNNKINGYVPKETKSNSYSKTENSVKKEISFYSKNDFVLKSHENDENHLESKIIMENDIKQENIIELLVENLQPSLEMENSHDENVTESINPFEHLESNENTSIVTRFPLSNEEECKFLIPVVEQSIEINYENTELEFRIIENPSDENINDNFKNTDNNFYHDNDFNETNEKIENQSTETNNQIYFENKIEDNSTDDQDDNFDNTKQIENINEEKNVYFNDENETIEVLDTNTETDEDINNLNSLTDMEYENIYCTDEKLEEEILQVDESIYKIQYKRIGKTPETFPRRNLDNSHRQSATTITNVTSISDENINLNYQADIKKPKFHKKGNKFIRNIFAKFKKRRIIAKPEINEPTTVQVESTPLENHDFFDEASIDCHSQNKGLEIDSNKALKSYDDSINNIGDTKQITDDEFTESDNVFTNENAIINTNKVNEINVQQQTIIIELKSLNNNSNTQSPVKDSLVNDIESLDNSFKFLKDFEKDSLKADNEEDLMVNDKLINRNQETTSSIPKQVVENQNPSENNYEIYNSASKTFNEPCEKTDPSHSFDRKSKNRIKSKFLTLFSHKDKKSKSKRAQSLPRDNGNKNDNRIDTITTNTIQTNSVDKPIKEFNEVINCLKAELNDQNEKVICKNKNGFPLNIVEECLMNKENSYTNDDYLFPDAITPSKIIHFQKDESYNFPFIDDSNVVAQDSLTMYNGENKVRRFLTEFYAPCASLETLTELNNDAQFGSSESLHVADNYTDAKLSEKPISPLCSNKRPISAILDRLSRTR